MMIRVPGCLDGGGHGARQENLSAMSRKGTQRICGVVGGGIGKPGNSRQPWAWDSALLAGLGGHCPCEVGSDLVGVRGARSVELDLFQCPGLVVDPHLGHQSPGHEVGGRAVLVSALDLDLGL